MISFESRLPSVGTIVPGLDLVIGNLARDEADDPRGGTLVGRLAAFEKARMGTAIVACRGRLKSAREASGRLRNMRHHEMRRCGPSRRDLTGGPREAAACTLGARACHGFCPRIGWNAQFS